MQRKQKSVVNTVPNPKWLFPSYNPINVRLVYLSSAGLFITVQMAATFRSLGSPLPAARHAQLHSTGSGPAPATERGPRGTWGRLVLSMRVATGHAQDGQCSFPPLHGAHQLPLAQARSCRDWSLLWLHLGSAFRWLLPLKGEAARTTQQARQLRACHPTPTPTLGLPRESGWKMELRKKKKNPRACTEQATGFPTYVRVYTATATATATTTAGESGEIKGFSRAPLWASGCTCAWETVTSREVASMQEGQLTGPVGGWTPGEGQISSLFLHLRHLLVSRAPTRLPRWF